MKKGLRSLFGPARDIDVRTVGAQVVCTAEGQRLLSHSCEGHGVTEAVPGYVQFVRYRYGEPCRSSN